MTVASKSVQAILVAILVCTVFAPTPVFAAPAAERDAKGAQDHPLIKRFAGSWLYGYKSVDWDQAAFPTSMVLQDRRWAKPLIVEGRITREFYMAPVGKSPLEVFRNYQQALTAAGFKQTFSCESNCSDLYFAMHQTLDYGAGVLWSDGSLAGQGGGSYSLSGGVLSSDQGRLWYGTLPRNGQVVHVLLYTSVAENETTNRTATFLQIAEPKAMPTGQVQVDAAAMGQGLQQSGKIALYGLYFDSGKAVIKPESKSQLAEMAKLLQEQPSLRVFIVGHTDNQGASESNMALSLQRAQAVVGALTTDYKVDSKRVAARGVGSLAPLESNAAESGRSKNRRVELVLQ